VRQCLVAAAAIYRPPKAFTPGAAEQLRASIHGRSTPRLHGYGIAVFSKTQGDVSTPTRPFSRWRVYLVVTIAKRFDTHHSTCDEPNSLLWVRKWVHSPWGEVLVRSSALQACVRGLATGSQRQ